ncbi:hypothetical protein G5C63_19685 [Stenotrophomonas pavanii]|uniref:hypothetical protein n=1 Tax=Stenotrophomonas pavanii TaxID=487698 RepID=UPI0013DF0000|nr:hypothetical protein [Stenotrophomonas pavanii]NGM56530.1 hypothetical protein [Stenotrophomonas pavanii]
MDVEQRARQLLADEFARMGGVSAKYVEEVREGIVGPWDRAAILAIIAALTPPEGYVLVPVQPTPGLLMSMAIRGDHALGCPGYYDQEMFTAGGHVGHQRILEVAISEARNHHEEVVGTGFYTPEKEAAYVAMLAVRPEVKP